MPAKHPSCTRRTGRCSGDPAECLNAWLRARVWLCVQAAAACCMGRSRRTAPPKGRPACQGWGCGATAHKAHAATGNEVMLSSRAGLGEDWGTAELAAALYTFSTDVTRIKPLLPELSPADRCTPYAPRTSRRRGRVGAARPWGSRSRAGRLPGGGRCADLHLARCRRPGSRGLRATGFMMATQPP